MAVVAALVAGLIAAASLLPKQKAPIGVIAAVAVLAFLLVLAEIIQKPEGVSIGWALYVVIVLTFLQSAVAIGALLLDAGIISRRRCRSRSTSSSRSTARTAQPNQYYGQHAPHQGGQQRVRPTRASTAAVTPVARRRVAATAAIGQQGGPPTPPTGFPTYGQPQASQSAPSGQAPGAAAVVVIGSSSSSSNQSGNSTS